MKKKIIFGIIFLITFTILPINTKATTLGDLYDDLYELEQQKEEKDNEKQISEAEYNRTNAEIIQIEENVSNLNARIQEATEKIKELEEEIQKKDEETKKILVFLQLSSGEKSYLEYIFKAKTFTDFIHRVSVVEQLSKYNTNLIKEMNDLIKQNNELKEQLKEDIKKEEAEREVLKEKLSSIRSKLSELDEHTTTIEEDIETQKSLIAFYEDMGCTDKSDNLATCGEAVPSATGFLRPITKGILTSSYGYRINPLTGYGTSFHSGVDLSDSSPAEGKDIYSVAPGIVSTIQRWGCGGNVVFIYHNINGTKYTSVYMHLLDVQVNTGDVVTANTIIGHMGGYSTSTAHGGYDSCTTGAHLHLTISWGHVTAANYRSSLIDPASVIYFPGGWFYSRNW